MALRTRELLGYGVGDAGQAMIGTLIGFYQLYYFTDVMRLPLASVAGLFLLTKILDSASFPLFGLLLDRTPGGVGAFLRWRLWLIVPSFAVSVLLFTFDHSWSVATRVVYAYVVVSAFVVLTALVSVVYTGLASAISLQARDRAKLSTIRFVFAFGAGTVATFSVQHLVDAFGGKEGGGFQAVAFIFSVFAAASLYITGSMTQRHNGGVHGMPPDVLHSTSRILRDPTFLAPVVATFFTGLFVAFKSQMTLYFITYVMHREDVAGMMLAGGTVSCAIGVALVGLLINRVDRRAIYVSLMGGSAALIAAMFFVSPADVRTLVALQCMNSALGGACSPVIFSIYSDVVDYLDDKLSFRAPALVNSVAMLAGRLGGSLGMVLTPLGLAFFHYRANEQQSAGASFGITLMFTLVPAGFAALSAVAMATYSLTNRASDKISLRLSAQEA